MMSQHHIICVGLPTWEGDYMKTIVQIMSLLGRKHRVLYVEYPFTWKDVAMGVLRKGKSTPWKRVIGQENRLRTISTEAGSEVHVLTLPAVWPTNWISSAKRYDFWIGREAKKAEQAILAAADQLGFQSPVVINAFNPFFGLPLVGRLKEKALLYYCYDEISAASWCSKHGERLEKGFLEHVDAAVVTSEALLNSKKQLQPATFLVKNGVNFSLFNQGYQAKPPLSVSPTVGYLGSVDDRLDTALLAHLFRSLPHFTFEFVGRVVSEKVAALLRAFSNVRVLGSKPPATLPSCIAHWSAGLIPFVQDEFTRNIYPLKINEYLAAGLPVVMTPFAKLKEFEGIVSIAGKEEEYAQALQKVVLADTATERAARVAFARENSWERRVEELEELIEETVLAKERKTITV